MIIIEDLEFAYSGQNYILKNINLKVQQGDYVSVLGDNGCGKTTLMRIILGFLKPTKGKMIVNTKSIGYVPQKNDFMGNGFPITVYEVLYSYYKLLKLKDKNRIIQVLEYVGMIKCQNMLMGNLSGGQTQKILIARALLGNPKLLILDEPSTGVDRDSQTEIYRLIKNLCDQDKITVISVEHNLEAAVQNSNKIFHMKEGRGHICSPQKYATEYLKSVREE